ncbi:dsDNA nuclease domain-containing protein [Massilia sp. YIM B02443]|nr:dsDNA nuclease domain-containing protein [Massilia sp. YIM B02443]
MGYSLELHERQPREQDGRDSFDRYRAQTRAAAIAALSILEGKEIDRVYCDLHDDFVIRKSIGISRQYVFTQVKTRAKANKNWTVNEIFGLTTGRGKKPPAQQLDTVKDSFVGKLLLHAILFDTACESTVFQTNINLDDAVLEIVEDIREGKFSNKYSIALLQIFNDCFKEELLERKLTDSEIRSCITKLCFESDVQHLKLKDHGFGMIVREKIHFYSEVDLGRTEVDEILIKLLALVESKSAGRIEKINAESIEKLAGISIDDLLDILSISKDAYRALLDAGDDDAIKAVSIIQRTLKKAGADNSEIEFCSRCKTNWDIWLRNNRHIIPEFDLQAIISSIRNSLGQNVGMDGKVKISELRREIRSLIIQFDQDGLSYDLTPELILGGFFSSLVRNKQ